MFSDQKDTFDTKLHFAYSQILQIVKIYINKSNVESTDINLDFVTSL